MKPDVKTYNACRNVITDARNSCGRACYAVVITQGLYHKFTDNKSTRRINLLTWAWSEIADD